MHERLVWALPLLLSLVGCKPKPTEEPDEPRGPSLSADYSAQAFQAPTSIQPVELCEHLARMVAAEAGVPNQPIDPQMMAECETELTMEAALRGTDNWNDIAACVLASRNEAELDQCDRRFPLPGDMGDMGDMGERGEPGDLGDLSLEREICEHMIEVLLRDGAEQQAAPPELREDELLGLREQCARSLVLDQRPYLRPDDYLEMLQCIGRAESSAQLHDCQ
jgi:hypothetical protein